MVIALGNCEAYVPHLCRITQTEALQEVLLHPRQPNLPSYLGNNICAFSIFSVEETREIMVVKSHEGLTFFGPQSLSPNLRIRQYESERILGLSDTFNGISLLYLNVHIYVYSGDNLEESQMPGCTWGYLVFREEF